MIRTTWGRLFLGVFSTVLAASAFAGQIDRTAFDGDQRVEVSFANLPMDFGRAGPVVAGGITFTSGFGSFRTYPANTFTMPDFEGTQVCMTGCIMTNGELDFISVVLPEPVSLVGAYLGIVNESTTAVAEFYSGATLLGSVNVSARPFEGVFAGWDAGSAVITSVKFIDNQNQQFVLGLSGFTYQIAPSVPEPSSLALALMGSMALAGAVRRGQRRSA